MTKTPRVLFIALSLVAGSLLASIHASQSAAQKHFPPKGKWEARDPASLGLDKAKLDEAIAFAVQNQNQRTKDLAVDIPGSNVRVEVVGVAVDDEAGEAAAMAHGVSPLAAAAQGDGWIRVVCTCTTFQPRPSRT